MTMGTLFEIREFSLFDGPGIRTTVFLKGCPLRCVWCHNPEGIRRGPELLVTRNLCRGCGRCREVCPINGGGCRACGRCVSVCPERIRRICGESIDESALLARLLRHRDLFDSEEGGVTFSGGEPLLQADWTAACAERLRAEGISTTVETCGYASEEDYQKVIRAVDGVIQDLKHPDPILHRRWTGRDNGPILRNLQWLKGSDRPFIVRIPLIPGVNDSLKDLSAFADLLTGAPRLLRVELLPFHAAGRAKRLLLKSDPTVQSAETSGFWETVREGDASEDKTEPFFNRGIPCRIA